MSVVSDVEIRLRADIARLRADLNEGRRETRAAFADMSASANAFKGALEGVAAGLSVGAFVSFIKNSIDATDALNDMSVRTKVAIEDLAGLAYAAKLGDTSLEGVAGAISKLGTNIGKDGAKFRELGITATEPLEAFKQLADIFKNIQDPQQRAAFGAEVLGKSWQEAAVLLDGGSQGIAELVDKGKELSGVTEQVAADAGAFNDQLDTLSFAAQGLGTRIAAGLLPTLQKMAESMSATDVSGENLSGTITVLSAALKSLYSLGVGVGTLFTSLGKSIGGTAAVISAGLSGGLSGAASAYKALASDVAGDWADAAKSIASVWSDSTDEVKKDAEDSGKAAADAGAKVKAFLDSAEIAAARKKAADQAEALAERQRKAYAGLIASIKEKMAADQAEIDGGVALTPIQRMRVKLDEELREGKISLTKEQVKGARAWLDDAEALEKNAGAAKQTRDATAALADERQKSYETLVAEAATNEQLVATYGKTKLEIAELTLAREEDRLAQRASLDLSEDTVAQLEREIEARRRNVAAMRNIDDLDKREAEQTAFWGSIDKTAHDTFVSIANGGKDAATRLKDTFKNIFFDWLYQQTIKKWLINVETSTSGTSTLAGAAGSSGGLSVTSLYTAAKNAYTAISDGFGSIASGAAEAVQKGLNLLGPNSSFYSASGVPATSLASAAGTAASTLAGYGIGSTLNSLISGQYKTGSGTQSIEKISTLVASYFAGPLGGTIAGVVSGLVNRAFGMGAKTATGTSLSGTLTPTGATGNTLTSWTQKGGWFRSNKSGTDATAFTDSQVKAFSDTYKAILDVSKAMGEAVGANTDALSSRVQALNINLTGLTTEADQLAAVSKFFAGVGDTIATELVPNLAQFQTEGEALSTTLQRVAADYAAVDGILGAMGKTFGAVGASSIAAREGLIKAAGGLDALASGVAYFQQNYYTDAQRLEKTQTEVAASLAAMGLSGLKTTEQFKAATLGIDLTTQAGADLFAKMLALAPAFKTVADAAQAQAEAAIAAAQASAKAAEELAAAKAAEELKKIADAAALLSSAVTSALSGVQKAVAAQKDSNAKAFDDLMKSIGVSIDKATSRITELQDIASALSTGVAGASSLQSEMTTSAARAALSAAAQVARSGGGLPAADTLRTLLGTIRADNGDQYSTLIEYQRATAAANNDIAALAGATDTELSVAQRTLTTLQDQKQAAQMAYDAENMRLDAILVQAQATVDRLNGIYTGVLAIPEALAQLAASIKAATSNPVSGAGASTAAAYNSYLGRNATEAELAYWKDQATKGVDVNGAIKGSDEARIQALYQQYLGRTGEAAGVDAWEAALAAGQTWQQIEAGFAGSPEAQGRSGSSDVVIAALTEQMANMQASMARTAAATTKLAEQFDQVSGGGGALLTEPL